MLAVLPASHLPTFTKHYALCQNCNFKTINSKDLLSHPQHLVFYFKCTVEALFEEWMPAFKHLQRSQYLINNSIEWVLPLRLSGFSHWQSIRACQPSICLILTTLLAEHLILLTPGNPNLSIFHPGLISGATGPVWNTHSAFGSRKDSIMATRWLLLLYTSQKIKYDPWCL